MKHQIINNNYIIKKLKDKLLSHDSKLQIKNCKFCEVFENYIFMCSLKILNLQSLQRNSTIYI